MAALSPKHESFARGIAAGLSKTKAYALAYGRNDNWPTVQKNASRLWRALAVSKQIRARVDQLMAKRRKALELTYERNLDDLLLEADLASAAGQHAAAITARKLIGQELHQAFTDRREITNINLDCIQSMAELKAHMIAEYGEQVTEHILGVWDNKLIEHDTTDGETITDSRKDTDTETPNKNSLQSSDSASKRGLRHDLAHQGRLAARSLADGAPPYKR